MKSSRDSAGVLVSGSSDGVTIVTVSLSRQSNRSFIRSSEGSLRPSSISYGDIICVGSFWSPLNLSVVAWEPIDGPPDYMMRFDLLCTIWLTIESIVLR